VRGKFLVHRFHVRQSVWHGVCIRRTSHPRTAVPNRRGPYECALCRLTPTVGDRADSLKVLLDVQGSAAHGTRGCILNDGEVGEAAGPEEFKRRHLASSYRREPLGAGGEADGRKIPSMRAADRRHAEKQRLTRPMVDVRRDRYNAMIDGSASRSPERGRASELPRADPNAQPSNRSGDAGGAAGNFVLVISPLPCNV
jgi:hypothetical protein